MHHSVNCNDDDDVDNDDDLQQIYNVYSLGLAIVSVVFLQWLLLYQRRHEEPDHDMACEPSVDLSNDDTRPSSPEIVLPSITILPPSPSHSDSDDEPAEVEANSSAAPTDPSPAVTDIPASPANDDYNDDNSASETLPALPSAHSTRRNSGPSANVLQMINAQRRFSVSATSAKSATAAGGVTGQLCTVIY